MASVPASRRKALGAFYTHPDVVRFLVGWALARRQGTVLDPSCGDGRFLAEAAAAGAKSVSGFDVDPAAVAVARCNLSGANHQVAECDFFTVDPTQSHAVDLVVGNPPFIRYHHFSGESRRLALASAARLGVRLTQLTSSWAPFLLHAVQFLVDGGCMAMVAPVELLQTQYGLPVLRAMSARFRALRLVTFEDNLFGDAQTETCLLLAEGLGGGPCDPQLTCLRGVRDLQTLMPKVAGGATLRLDDDRFAVAEAYLAPSERDAWQTGRGCQGVRQIGLLGTVFNGYVTGDNEFFHTTTTAAAMADVPPTWLVPVARSARSVAGARYTEADIHELERRGAAHHLVVPDDLPPGREALARFCAIGLERGVADRFKCRSRRPWWRVPSVHRPDVILPYMIGEKPRAAHNEAHAAIANGLHGLRAGLGTKPAAVALSCYSSLSLLSMEIEGRTYGGGILKLEPSEMARVCVPVVDLSEAEALAALARTDELVRHGDYAIATETVDSMLLLHGLGWPKALIALLREARQRLVRRRMSRRRGERHGAA